MCAKKIIKTDEELENKKKDFDKMIYLFFNRCFFIQDIERYFNGKYTYNEIKNVIRGKING